MTDTPAIQKIRVVNRNTFTIRDRYDGVPYEFPPNKAVSLDPAVAEHILGFPGDDMHRHMGKRWGWNLPEHYKIDEETGVMVWEAMCRKIEVSVERFELRRVRGPNEPIPADDDEVGLMEPAAPLNRPKKTRRMNEGLKKYWDEKRKQKAQLGKTIVPAPTEAKADA